MWLRVPFLTVGALTVDAHSDDWEAKGKDIHRKQGIQQSHGGHKDVLAAKVKGQGTVDMLATADDTEYGVFAQGDLFVEDHFAVMADVHADGCASGDATFRVVMSQITLQARVEGPFSEEYHFGKEFRLHRANPSLAMGIQVRTAGRLGHGLAICFIHAR